MKYLRLTTVLASVFLYAVTQAQVNLSIDVNQTGIPMSQDLIGAFFEDINYGADGGLYAELVQNRSFEYYVVSGYTSLGPLTAWTPVQAGGAQITLTVENLSPLNSNNTHYLKMAINQTGTAAGVYNNGFNGIAVKNGEQYDFSVYLKRDADFDKPVIIQLKNKAGGVLATDTIKTTTDSWKPYTLVLTPKLYTPDAQLHILPQGGGNVYLDMVSLFPQKTFKNRKNGLRTDLAQAIADLKPQFLRFPGGCVSHGRGLANAYRWKHTVGDVAQRKPNWNLWGYHQTYGLGFYEYFLYCEDINCKPLPVLPVGVSCQFRNREVTPMNQMQEWVDDALDLIEFANGDSSTTWGKVRADMGHPAPFELEYLCLSNEEDDIPEFRERFMLIANAVRAKYPAIKIIGTSGTDDTGGYYHSLWEFSRENNLDAVDEHYYNSPDWFLNNNHRYDYFDRQGPKVFIGEYASQDDRLYNAIAEAAYLTGVERNADIIELTCYAPLLCNEQNNQWHPDLIRFDNTNVVKTASYYVQQLYGVNAGDVYLPSTLTYTDAYTPAESPFKGKVGVGSWNTQADFDDLTITVGENTLANDDFSAGSANWQVSAGTFNATGGVYTQSSTAQPAYSIFQTDVDNDTYTYTIKARKTGGAEGFLIPFGYKDGANYYWFNIGGWGNSQHAIEQVSNGTKSVLMSTSGSINNNQWYLIKLIASKDGVLCYIDDKLIFNIPTAPGPVTASVTEDMDNQQLIVKMVNSGETALTATIDIPALSGSQTVEVTRLTGNKTDRNTLASPNLIKPTTVSMDLSKSSTLTLPAYSMQVFRFDKPTNFTKPVLSSSKDGKASPLRLATNASKQGTRLSFEYADGTPYHVRLYNPQGKMVLEREHQTQSQINLNTAGLPASTYLVTLEHRGKQYTESFVLK
jgi:alpha-L-arabinofuranosidase